MFIVKLFLNTSQKSTVGSSAFLLSKIRFPFYKQEIMPRNSTSNSVLNQESICQLRKIKSDLYPIPNRGSVARSHHFVDFSTRACEWCFHFFCLKKAEKMEISRTAHARGRSDCGKINKIAFKCG